MTTFAKATFDSARYALSRPTYPRQLFDAVFRYHEQGQGARWDLAVDIGCGTGSFWKYHPILWGPTATRTGNY
jgi:hypothetical protein